MSHRYGNFEPQRRQELIKFREAAIQNGQHKRTPEIVGNLALGLRWFLDFARDIGAIDDHEQKALWNRGWAALGRVAEDQTAHQVDSDPVSQFLTLLSSAIGSGAAHVADSDGNAPSQDGPAAWGWRQNNIGTGAYEREEWRPCGQRVGWVSGDDLYLDLNAAFRAAEEMAGPGRSGIPVTPRTLTKRLCEGGLLKGTEQASRNTLKTRKHLEGRRRSVLHLPSASLTSHELDQPDPSDRKPATPEPTAASGSDLWSSSGDSEGETRPEDPTRAPEDSSAIADPGGNGRVGQVLDIGGHGR